MDTEAGQCGGRPLFGFMDDFGNFGGKELTRVARDGSGWGSMGKALVIPRALRTDHDDGGRGE